MIAALFSLVGYAPKIVGDRADRLAGLEIVRAASDGDSLLGCSDQDFLGAQCFAPKRDKSYAVQQGRMKRPQSHRETLVGLPSCPSHCSTPSPRVIPLIA